MIEFFEVLQTLVILQSKIDGSRNDSNHTFKYAAKRIYVLYLVYTLKLSQKIRKDDGEIFNYAFQEKVLGWIKKSSDKIINVKWLST